MKTPEYNQIAAIQANFARTLSLDVWKELRKHGMRPQTPNPCWEEGVDVVAQRLQFEKKKDDNIGN